MGVSFNKYIRPTKTTSETRKAKKLHKKGASMQIVKIVAILLLFILLFQWNEIESSIPNDYVYRIQFIDLGLARSENVSLGLDGINRQKITNTWLEHHPNYEIISISIHHLGDCVVAYRYKR